MKEDPFEWLGQHREAGVHLREEGDALRTDDAVPAWERKAAAWAKELIEGVMFWSPQDGTDIEPLDKFPVERLEPENPFYDPDAVDLGMTATGPGRRGNSPYNRHAALVARAKKILDRWKKSPPKQHNSPGRKPTEHTEGIELARKLYQEGKSKRDAARIAVEEIGHGPHASVNAAIDQIRKQI